MATKALVQGRNVGNVGMSLDLVDKTDLPKALHPIAREMQNNSHAKSGKTFFLCPVDAAEVEHNPHMLKGYKFVPAGPRRGRVRNFRLVPTN